MWNGYVPGMFGRRVPRKTLGSYNPINAAQNLGRQFLKDPGALFFHEFQVSHILTCLGHKHFSDNPDARIRRHCWIEAPTGIGKTTLMRKFASDVIGGTNVLESGFTSANPTYAELTGSGVTWESMRGSSSSKGGLVKPIFFGIDYLLAPELMSFVGNKQGSAHERVNELCSVLEEGQVSVRLIKMAEANEKAWERFSSDCDELGITVNDDLRGFTYEAGFSMWGATRPLRQEDNADYIRESGLRPRFSISAFEANEDQMRTFRRRQFGKMDPQQLDRLRRFNLFAYRTHVDEVLEPPKEMVHHLIDYYYDHYERIADGAGMSINDVASGRDVNDACQLLVARCAADTFVKAWEQDKAIIRGIEYEPKYMDWVKAFKEPYFSHLHDDCMSHSNDSNIVTKYRNSIKKILAKAIDGGAVPIDVRSTHPVIPSVEIIPTIKKDYKCNQAKAYQHLKEMRNLSVVELIKPGQYEVIDRNVLKELDLGIDPDTGNIVPVGDRRKLLVKAG